MKTYLTIRVSQKFKKEHKLSKDYYRKRRNTRLYNPMFQCHNGIFASLQEQYPKIYGRLVNTILAVPTAGKAVNPKRVCKTDGQLRHKRNALSGSWGSVGCTCASKTLFLLLETVTRLCTSLCLGEVYLDQVQI